MHTTISLALHALLFAAAEAGPLNAPGRREAAVKRWAQEQALQARQAPNSGAFGGFLSTVVTVSGEVLKGPATVSSFLSGTSILPPPATTTKSAETQDAAKPSSRADTTSRSPTGVPNSKIPTAVTKLPPATGAISPELFQTNLKAAQQFNTDFSTLTKDTSCIPNQAACIDGQTALCSSSGAFVLEACAAPGTSCFALPLETAEGVQLKCVDRPTAEKILGALPAGGSSSSAAPVPGEFTKTAIITASTGAVTITLTVRPQPESSQKPAASEADSTSTVTVSQTKTTTATTTAASSTSTEIPLEVIPIDDPVTTITTTVFTPARPTDAPRRGGPPQGNPDRGTNPEASSSPPASTRTRTRRPQPTESQQPGGGNGGGGRGGGEGGGGEAKPTGAPGGGNGGGNGGTAGGGKKGPNEDTRVTFTLTETATVTEKETVTVTAAGAGATVTKRVAVRMM